MFKKNIKKKIFESSNNNSDIKNFFSMTYQEPFAEYEKINANEVLDGLKEMIDFWVNKKPTFIKDLRFNSINVDLEKKFIEKLPEPNKSSFSEIYKNIVKDYGEFYLDKIKDYDDKVIFLLVNGDKDPIKIGEMLGAICDNEDDFTYISKENNIYSLYDVEKNRVISVLGNANELAEKLYQYDKKDYENKESEEEEVKNNTRDDSLQNSMIVTYSEDVYIYYIIISYIISLLSSNKEKIKNLDADFKLTSDMKKNFDNISYKLDLLYTSINLNEDDSIKDDFSVDSEKVEKVFDDVIKESKKVFKDFYVYLTSKKSKKTDKIGSSININETIKVICEIILDVCNNIEDKLMKIQGIEFPYLDRLNKSGKIMITKTAIEAVLKSEIIMQKFLETMKK